MRRSKVELKMREEAPESATRRRFAKSIAATALAAAAAPFASSIAHSQTPSTAKETPAPPKPQPSPAANAQAAQPPSPLAVAYAEVARVRFGEQVTPEQLAQIQKDLAGNVRTADRLRAVKLKNEDEPDFVFSA